jgi:hypothetical protein
MRFEIMHYWPTFKNKTSGSTYYLSSQPIAVGFKPVQHPVGYPHIFAGMNAFLRLVAIPARHIESKALALIGESHQAHVAVHR